MCAQYGIPHCLPSSGQLTIEQDHFICAQYGIPHCLLFIKINIGATLKDFSSGVLILEDGKQCGIPYCAHIKRSCSIVSWPEDGCMSSRNMSPRAK